MGQKFGGDSFKKRERERERVRVAAPDRLASRWNTSRIDTAVLRLRKTEDRRGWDRFFADFRSRSLLPFFSLFFFSFSYLFLLHSLLLFLIFLVIIIH